MVGFERRGISCNGQNISFSRIYETFASSVYGQKLKRNIRWSAYNKTAESFKNWQDLLGVDANNLLHMQYTFYVALFFLHYCQNPSFFAQNEASEDSKFTKEEQELLLFAAVSHDWGEAVVGDIPYYAKTEEDESREYNAFISLSQKLYGQDGNQDLMDKIEQVADCIFKNKDSKLGKAFNTIEGMGYLRTGLKAWRKSDDPTVRQELADNLKHLAFDVLASQIPTLIERSNPYPAVWHFLVIYAERISDAYTRMPDDIAFQYPLNQREQYITRFSNAKAGWLRWRESQLI